MTYSEASFEVSEKSLVDIEKSSEPVRISRLLMSDENVVGLGQSYIALASSSHIPLKSNATKIDEDKYQARKKRQFVSQGMYFYPWMDVKVIFKKVIRPRTVNHLNSKYL